MTKLESINNDEFHLKNLLCMEYGKGLLVFDDRHMINLALKEMQMDLTRKLTVLKYGMNKKVSS